MKKSALIFRGPTPERKKAFNTNSTGDTLKRKRSTFKLSFSRFFKRPKNLPSVEECTPKKAGCFSFGFWRRPKPTDSSSPDLTPAVPTGRVSTPCSSFGASECECTRNNVNDNSVNSQTLGELRKTLQSLVNEVRNEGFELTSLIRQSVTSARTDPAICGQLSSINEMSLSESGDCLPVIPKRSYNDGSLRTEDAVKTPPPLSQFLKAESDKRPVDVASVDPDEAGLSTKLQIISKNLRSLLGEFKQDSTELAALLRLSLLSPKASSSDQTVAPDVAPPLVPSLRDLNDIQKNVDDLTSSVRSEARQIKSMVCESLRRRSQMSLKDETNWNADCTHHPNDYTLISAPTTCNQCPPLKCADVDLNGIKVTSCGRFKSVQGGIQCTLNESDKDFDNREAKYQQCRVATPPEDLIQTSMQPQVGITEGLQRLRRSIGDLAEVVRSENQQLKSVLQESLVSGHPRFQLFADRESETSPNSEASLRTENPANSCPVCPQGAEAVGDLTDEMDALKSKIHTLQRDVYNAEETQTSLLRRLHAFSSSSLVHGVRTSVASQTAADEKLEELKRNIGNLADGFHTEKTEIKSTAEESLRTRPLISLPVTIQLTEQTLPVENTIHSESLPATGDALRADDAKVEEGTGSQAGLIAVLEVVGRNLLGLADEVHRNSLELTALMRQSIPHRSNSLSAVADRSAAGPTHEGLDRLKSGINDLTAQIQTKNSQMKTFVQEWLKGAASSGRKDCGSWKKRLLEQEHSQALPTALPKGCESTRTLGESSLPLALDTLWNSVRTLTEQVHNSTAELTSMLRNSVRAAMTVSDQPERTEALQELLKIRQSIVALAEEVWSKNKRIKSFLQSSFCQPSADSQKSDSTSCESLSLTGTEAQSSVKVTPPLSSKLPHPTVVQATEELRDIKKSIRDLAVVVHSGKKQIKEVLYEALKEKKEDFGINEINPPVPAELNIVHPANEASSTNAVLLAGLDRLNASMRSLASSLYSLPEFAQNAHLTAKPGCQGNRDEGIQTSTDLAVLKTLEEVKKSVILIGGSGQGDKPYLSASAQAVDDKETSGGVTKTSALPSDLHHSLLLKVLETTHESLLALGRVSAPEASPEAAKKTEIMQLIAGVRESLHALGKEKRLCEKFEEAPRKICRPKRTETCSVEESSATTTHKKTVKRGKVKRRKKSGTKRLKKRDLEDETDGEQTQGAAPVNYGSHVTCQHQIGYPQRVTSSYYAPPPMAPPMRYWRLPPHMAAVRWPSRPMPTHMHVMPSARWEPPASVSKPSAQIHPANTVINPSSEVRRRR
uniref:Uncharacterized protein n=1 Tax=Schistocephalus solidus TaxID=70667 RepID=A0A0X3NPD5_SCHSO